MVNFTNLKRLCQLVRYDILTSTTTARSGHPTSSLSAVELMTTLFFGGYLHYDYKNPLSISNDRVIFSKGHAAPLLYALYHAAGAITEKELMTLRQFNSPLEGHPTPRFKYVDVATGSLGQGLSVGLGMALGIQLRITELPACRQAGGLRIKRKPKVFVLLGDGEMAEGQIWEALASASYYKLNNLVGILDVNRLGQNGETMLGWDLSTYEKRLTSFGWATYVIDDGHDLEKIYQTYDIALNDSAGELKKPIMILAKTIKGKGVSFLENKEGWHGKTVPKKMLRRALKDIGENNIRLERVSKKLASYYEKI